MKTLHIVPHFHYDVAFIMTSRECLDVATKNIKDVLKLMRSNRQYKFCLDQVFLLKGFKRKYPFLWVELKQRVIEGRIELVCGMVTMPDTFIPSGESIVRNILLGKRFIKKEFGKDVDFGWIIDPYGHSPQIPQVLKKSGFLYHSIGGSGMPYDSESEFEWIGLDGSYIFTVWMVEGYGPLNKHRDFIKTFNRAYPNIIKRAATDQVFVPNGADFSPPHEEVIPFMKSWNKTHKGSKMFYSTPSEFATATQRSRKNFLRIKGELISGRFLWLLPGTASSRMWIKMGNRRCENLLTQAETLSAMAWLTGSKYPGEELKSCWEKLMFVHFHDIIWGSIIDEVCAEVKEIFRSVTHSCIRLTESALNEISAKINISDKCIPLVVCNTLNWKRNGMVRITRKNAVRRGRFFQIIDEKNNVYPSVFKDGKVKFYAGGVPGVGYKVFYIICGIKQNKPRCLVKSGEDFIENEYFRIEIDLRDGLIKRVHDKKGGKEVTNGYLNELIGDVDVGHLYIYKKPTTASGKCEPAFTSRFKEEYKWISKQFPWVTPEKADVNISSDELVATVCSKSGFWYRGKPLILWEQKVQLRAYDDLIYFKTRITNNIGHVRIRVCFPVNIVSRHVWAEVPYGVVKRKTEVPTGKGWFSLPAETNVSQNWVDYENGNYGVTLINYGLPEYEIRNSKIYLTLLRSVDLHGGGGEGTFIQTPQALEKGTYDFEYALYPHKGNWQEAKSYSKAYEHNNPLIAKVGRKRQVGRLAPEWSAFESYNKNIVVTAFKKSEDRNDLLLRFFETEGRYTRAHLKFGMDGIISKTDLLEREQEKKGGKVECSVAMPFDIKKFSIETIKLRVRK